MKKILTKSIGRIVRDPDVVKHQGKYYLCYSAGIRETGDKGICIACADSIEELNVCEDHFVYITEKNKPWSHELWAPELHYLDGNWYIYVACDDGHNENHRMYVLANHSEDPLAPYTLQGKITDSTDKWAIDANILHHNGEMYFVWSGWEGDENVAQNIYIAKMKNPCELASERVLISRPDQDWEKIGGTGTTDGLPFINEGPFAFQLGSDTYIAYSGSGSWCAGYCIALLKLVGDDPMNPDHWQKIDRPILCENDMVKGAGHCTIVMEDDGTPMVFFHAWDKDESRVRWDTVSVFCGTLVVDGDKITII